MIFILISIFSLSCVNEKKTFNDELSDSWSIDEIYYLGNNHMDSLNYNVIGFNFDRQGYMRIPRSYGYEEMNSKFEVIKNKGKFQIKINSKNHMFNDLFDVKFLYNGKGLKQINLISNELRIKAYATDLTIY